MTKKELTAHAATLCLKSKVASETLCMLPEENSGEGVSHNPMKQKNVKVSTNRQWEIEGTESVSRGQVSLFEHPGGSFSISSERETVTVHDDNKSVTVVLEYNSPDDEPKWVILSSGDKFNNLTEAIQNAGARL